MLVPEVTIVLQFLLGEDFEKFGIDRVGIAESLDCRKGGEVVEVVVSVGEKCGLECAEGQVLCFS